jgi:hypothetical protein
MAHKRRVPQSPNGISLIEENKLSDHILEMLDPFVDEDMERDSFALLVGLACVAWIATLAEEAVRPFLIADFVDKNVGATNLAMAQLNHFSKLVRYLIVWAT